MLSLKFKIFLLTLLYFVQGLPYGFQDKLIPVALRLTGSSFSRISLLKLLLVPWLLKTLWAPILVFKTNRFWLIFSILSLSAVCFIGSGTDITDIGQLGPLLLVMNFLSATQDIAVDTLAVNILTDSELGYGNTAQVVGYKLGSLFGGGTLLWLYSHIGNAATMSTFGMLYFICGLILCMIQIPEKVSSEGASISAIFYKLWKSFRESKSTLKVLVFITLYKLGERGCLSNFPLFLVDRKVNSDQLALWNGIVGQGSSILGSIYGGYIATRPLRTLEKYCVLRCFPILMQWFLVTYDTSYFMVLSVISLLLLNFTAGVITTLTFSIMMGCSKRVEEDIRGTHYTTLATVEVLGKLLFSSLSGSLIDSQGISVTFFVFFALSFLAIPLAGSVSVVKEKKLG